MHFENKVTSVTSVVFIPGIGNALVACPCVVVLAYYFQQRRNFFIALSVAVIGVAMNAASPLALYLLNTYGLKGTFLLTGGLCANLCVCSLLCKPSSLELEVKRARSSTTNRKPVSEDMAYVTTSIHSDNRIQKKTCPRLSNFLTAVLPLNIISLPFLAFLMSISTWNFMLSACLMHLPNYVVTKGLDESSIAVVMTVFSIANTSGRCLGAIALNQKRIHAMLLNSLALCCGGMLTILFPLYSHKYLGSYIFAALAGVFTGLPNSLMTAITLQLVGVDEISMAHSLEFFFCGIGVVLGPPVAGKR